MTAIYTRVSTLDQTKGYGIEVQREKCRQMAKLKDWIITEEYCDEAISGCKEVKDRPGFSKLLTDIKQKKIRHLIVYAIDRIGRTSAIVVTTIEDLTKMGVDVVSCRENLDTTTPTGRFTLHMFAALAQLERDTILERMTEGLEQRIKFDGNRGGRVGYGYDLGEMGNPVVNEKEAVIVRRIFKRREEKACFHTIAEELNRDNIQTKRGGKWQPSTISQIHKRRYQYEGSKRNGSEYRYPTILL